MLIQTVSMFFLLNQCVQIDLRPVPELASDSAINSARQAPLEDQPMTEETNCCPKCDGEGVPIITMVSRSVAAVANYRGPQC